MFYKLSVTVFNDFHVLESSSIKKIILFYIKKLHSIRNKFIFQQQKTQHSQQSFLFLSFFMSFLRALILSFKRALAIVIIILNINIGIKVYNIELRFWRAHRRIWPLLADQRKLGENLPNLKNLINLDHNQMNAGHGSHRIAAMHGTEHHGDTVDKGLYNLEQKKKNRIDERLKQLKQITRNGVGTIDVMSTMSTVIVIKSATNSTMTDPLCRSSTVNSRILALAKPLKKDENNQDLKDSYHNLHTYTENTSELFDFIDSHEHMHCLKASIAKIFNKFMKEYSFELVQENSGSTGGRVEGDSSYKNKNDKLTNRIYDKKAVTENLRSLMIVISEKTLNKVLFSSGFYCEGLLSLYDVDELVKCILEQQLFAK